MSQRCEGWNDQNEFIREPRSYNVLFAFPQVLYPAGTKVKVGGAWFSNDEARDTQFWISNAAGTRSYVLVNLVSGAHFEAGPFLADDGLALNTDATTSGGGYITLFPYQD